MHKLFHDDVLIGTVTKELPDRPATVGDKHLTDAAAKFAEIFMWFNDMDNRLYKEPPFAENLVEGWEMEDETGLRTEIFMPLLNGQGEIWWL